MGMEKGESSSYHSRPPIHFFKIILPHTIASGTLEIPPSFVEGHGKFLSKNACLEVSSGAMWKVRLKRREGRVFLRKGWREFVEDHSIKIGYFLVFQFEGGYHFRVLIFDKSALEIVYPVSAVHKVGLAQSKGGKITEKESEDEDEASVEILDEGWKKLHKRRKIKAEEEDSDGKSKTRQSSHLIQKKNLQGDVQVIKEGKGVKALSARDRVLQRAKAFKSRHPHFIVTMKPSYVTGYLYVPASRARSYFLKMGNSKICLQGPDGTSWSVDVDVDQQVRFRSGWRKFVQENHLQEGDVCIFELTNPAARVCRVTILHVANEKQTERDTPPKMVHELHIADKQESHKAAANSKNKNPQFIIWMCPTYVSRKGLPLPRSHTKRHLEDVKKGKTVIKLRSNGRTWPVMYRYAKSCDRGRFGRGWFNFASDNQLQAGDRCIFEMISGKTRVKAYNVTICREADHL